MKTKDLWTVGLAVLLAAFIGTNCQRTPADRQQAAPKAQPQALSVSPAAPQRYVHPWTPEEKRAINEAIKGLERLAEHSAQAKHALDFLRQNSVPACLDDSTVAVYPVDSTQVLGPTGFYLAPFISGFSVGAGSTTMAAGYLPRLRTLLITVTDLSTLVRGLLMAHELKHAEDNLVNSYTLGQRGSGEEVTAEMSAYGGQRVVLDQYTNGGWSRIVAESCLERAKFKEDRQIPPHHFTFDSVPGDSARIVNLLPGTTVKDLGPLTVILTMDANYALVDQFAQEEQVRFQGKRTFVRRYLDLLINGSTAH